MNAVLQPGRSLSRKAAAALAVVFVSVAILYGAAFAAVGAAPVSAFLGAEIAVLAVCFWLVRRAGRERTFVQVTAEEVRLRHLSPAGRERKAALPAYFARVEVEPPARGPGAVRITASGKGYRIGRFLTPGEQESFASALREALAAARRASAS